MISRRSVHALVTVIVLAIAIAPAGLEAQRRMTLSPGLALGAAFDGPRAGGSTWTSGRHALLTLDVEAAGLPVRLRGEAMAVALSQSHGPVSLGASAVLPLGRGRLRPYAVAGGGVYGVGGVGHPVGWSAGGGAEYRRRTATLFMEARRHSQTPSAVSVGVRF
jgi:hypothetical protein